MVCCCCWCSVAVVVCWCPLEEVRFGTGGGWPSSRIAEVVDVAANVAMNVVRVVWGREQAGILCHCCSLTS